MRKPAFCIYNNYAKQRRRSAAPLFCCIDSAVPLLLKPLDIFCSVAVQPGLCRTWSETPKTGFLTSRLMYMYYSFNHPKCFGKLNLKKNGQECCVYVFLKNSIYNDFNV